MPSDNQKLNQARSSRIDDFYTRMEDIDLEIRNYREEFQNKRVFCNCDSKDSSFYQYFKENFYNLGLKEVKAVCLNHDSCFVYDGEKETSFLLSGNGDFRSDECLSLAEDSDIIVTNPPFSLLREYIHFLMRTKKKFLFIGSVNIISYKEVFPFLKENLLWTGCTNFNKGMYFYVPDDFEYRDTYRFLKEMDGRKVNRVSGCCWFTNLDHPYRHKIWNTRVLFDSSNYEVFDELPQVINVKKSSEIPMDYDGYMAVPITFLNHFNPDQFMLVDSLNRYLALDSFGVNSDIRRRKSYGCNINGKRTYARLIIQRKK